MVYEIQKVIKKDILSEYVIIEDLFGDVLERIFGKTITQRQLSTMIRPDLRDLIKNAKNKQAIDTANKIQQMIIQKRPLSDIADHIDRSYPKTATSSSKRLAYTEDTFLVNEALQAVTGAKYYRYITAGDDRVCETCQALSGMRFAYADRVVGLNYPPMHPWCRCIALPEE
jgi:SPP1 gp7 family putative phage head morphogenesis protein